MAGMALWKRFWLLFSVMWVVVAALHAGTILATADEVEHGRAWVSAVSASPSRRSFTSPVWPGKG